jgi:small subunit ribosomal protein S18
MATNNTMATLPKYVDYKNTKYLSQFLTPHARMMGARKNDMPAREQRKIGTAVKRARFMALLPYISR